MLLATLLISAIVAKAAAATSSCIPKVVSTQIPSSVENEIKSAEVYQPSLVTIGSVVSTFELSSPLDATVETLIEYYEKSQYNLVSELESFYAYPSLYNTERSAVTEITTAYQSLARAISELISAEQTHHALASHQQDLQSVEVYYSSILTALSQYTALEYPSVYTASEVVSAATLTNPSIFGSVIAVSAAVSQSPTVSQAISYLSSAAYSLPSTVVTQILTIISSPSTVAASTISSLQSCYPALYSQLSELTSFTCAYPSVAKAVTAYLSAASTVSSLGSAVSTIVSKQMPTLTYELSVLQHAKSKQPGIEQDLSVLTDLIARSPSLGCAENTVEESFYASPSAAYSIYYALDYPSLISCPTQVSSLEASHESLVQAIGVITAWESYYTSSASLLHSIQSQLTCIFQSYRTLLSAYSYVQEVTSPSEASATAALSSLKAHDSDVTDVLSAIAYITQSYQSLQCVESGVARYADKYPSVAEQLWSAVAHPVPTSQLSFYDYLAAAYPSLASYFYQFLAYEQSYPSLVSSSLESSFISAASVDSSLLSQYDTLAYQSSAASQYLSSYATMA